MNLLKGILKVVSLLGISVVLAGIAMLGDVGKIIVGLILATSLAYAFLTTTKPR